MTRVRSNPAPRASVAPTQTSATAAQMKTATTHAKALAGFFAKTITAYKATLQQTNDQQKAIQQTFGAKTHVLDPKNMIGRQTLSGVFFYMSTGINTKTGALYQSMNAGPPYYGPLLPPPSARIKGHFSDDQAKQLLDIVAHG
jgi:hypothetical protein